MQLHVNLIQMYHELNDLITKVSMCEQISDPDLISIRSLVLNRVAEDFDYMQQKLSETFRIMKHNFDQGTTIGHYTSFDRWMGNIDYE